MALRPRIIAVVVKAIGDMMYMKPLSPSTAQATATDRMMVATTKTLINTMSPLEGVSQKNTQHVIINYCQLA